MTAFEIALLAIPDTLDGPGGADFVEMTRVRNEIEAESMNDTELAATPAELLPRWQDTEYHPMKMLVARVDGRIVARSTISLEIATPTVAWISVEVLPAHRRVGIGSALLEAATAIIEADGRTVIQCEVNHPPAAGETIAPPTGFGAVPLDAPGTRFVLKHGFQLEQVARGSRLPLPVDAALLDRYRAEAERAAGPDYRLVGWEGRTPDDRLADIALLRSRMSTDAPSAGLDMDEDVWDESRVRAIDDLEATGPRVKLVAAAEYVPTGRLVAFSELVVPAEPDRPVHQEDTLVLAEHRGHRLGMLTKAANLVALQERHPGHPSVRTFNAEENRHMLSVNEALGFVPAVYEGAWKKVLR